MLIAGVAAGRGRVRGRGRWSFVLGVRRDVRASPASATPSIIRPTIRCCRTTCRASALGADVLLSTPSPACSASAVAPATLLFMQSHWSAGAALFSAPPSLGSLVAALLLSCCTGRAARNGSRHRRPRRRRQREPMRASTAGALLLSPPILLNLVFFILLSMSGGGLNNFLVVALAALYGTPARSPMPRSPRFLIDERDRRAGRRLSRRRGPRATAWSPLLALVVTGGRVRADRHSSISRARAGAD